MQVTKYMVSYESDKLYKWRVYLCSKYVDGRYTVKDDMIGFATRNAARAYAKIKNKENHGSKSLGVSNSIPVTK